MRVLNFSKGTTLAADCRLAGNFIKRFKGLMFRKGLPEGSGLLIRPCNSIHTFFMRFPIDVVFIDRNATVVHTISGIKPWRISQLVLRSKCVLELPAGTIKKCSVEVGDVISLKG